jgi:hypothetical protein
VLSEVPVDFPALSDTCNMPLRLAVMASGSGWRRLQSQEEKVTGVVSYIPLGFPNGHSGRIMLSVSQHCMQRPP